MKIKLKDKNSTLPNCWKECGAGKDDWGKLNSGLEIEVTSIPDSINSLVEISAKKKGDK